MEVGDLLYGFEVDTWRITDGRVQITRCGCECLIYVSVFKMLMSFLHMYKLATY